jgi:NAD(P)-dependent dehydrogenase (short-subunit alcohol dehydrogenase family)
MKKGRIEGKVVIVTGGTSGIGYAISVLFAEEGGKVVFCGRRYERGKEIERDFRKKGLDITFVQADMTKEEDIENLVNKTVEKYGTVDVLVGNAGMEVKIPLEKLQTSKDYDPIFNLNLKANFMITEKVLPYMIKNNKGSIIYIASISGGNVAIGPLSLYGATKAGLMEIAKYGTTEFGSRNIRFNTISPGLTKSEFEDEGSEFVKTLLQYIPRGKMAEAIEVAYAALFLASDEAPSVTGIDLIIDGGRSVF